MLVDFHSLIVQNWLSFFLFDSERTQWLLLQIEAQYRVVSDLSKLFLKASCAWNIISQIFDVSVKWAANPALFNQTMHFLYNFFSRFIRHLRNQYRASEHRLS
jgi:hypothetical protein